MSIVSEQKRAANRANAQKSTGPRTLAGKLVSRFNALKHGLTAKQIVLPGEDDQDWLALSHEMLARFRPVGRAERALVDRASLELWRLRRASLAEAACLAPAMEKLEVRRDEVGRPDPACEAAAVGAAVAKDFEGRRMVERIAVHETRIERSFERTLKLLDRVRAERPLGLPAWRRPAPPETEEAPVDWTALQAAWEAEADANLALPEP